MVVNGVVQKDSNGLTMIIPDSLSEILNSVSISTTRGVMHSTLKGTFLNNAILPIIDTKALLKNQR